MLLFMLYFIEYTVNRSNINLLVCIINSINSHSNTSTTLYVPAIFLSLTVVILLICGVLCLTSIHYFVSFILVIFLLTIVVMNSNSLINVLLVYELINIVALSLLVSSLYYSGSTMFWPFLVLIVVMVCEGSMGISVLVRYTRIIGGPRM